MRLPPSSAPSQGCSVTRRRFRGSIRGANAPSSASYGHRPSMIAHGMVRRHRRSPISLPKAAAPMRSRGNYRRLAACFKSMATKPIRPWPSAGEEQYRPHAAGVLPCSRATQVRRCRQADRLFGGAVDPGQDRRGLSHRGETARRKCRYPAHGAKAAPALASMAERSL